LEPNHPVLVRFKERKPRTVEEFAEWVAEERRISGDEHGRTRTGLTDDKTCGRSVKVGDSPRQSLPSSCLAANAALSLLNLACYLLDRQIERLAADFEKEGGFTERLYKRRLTARKQR